MISPKWALGPGPPLPPIPMQLTLGSGDHGPGWAILYNICVKLFKSQYDLEKKILKISKNKVNKSIKNYLYINPNLEKWKKVIKRFRR